MLSAGRQQQAWRDAKLSIELVPSSCWFSNLRSLLSREDWDTLRRHAYKQARWRCEICGGRGNAHPVECHELWHYDDQHHIQRLQRVIALCPACHHAKHVGLAATRGDLQPVSAHIAKVNGWDHSTAAAYLAAARQQCKRRGAYLWALDLSALEERYGIAVPAIDPARGLKGRAGGLRVQARVFRRPSSSKKLKK